MRHQARIRNNRSQSLRDVVPDTRNGPNRNPQQVQLQVHFSKYNRITKADENAMNVLHGLLYAITASQFATERASALPLTAPHCA